MTWSRPILYGFGFWVLVLIAAQVMVGCQDAPESQRRESDTPKCADDSTLLTIGKNHGQAKWAQQVAAADRPKDAPPAKPAPIKYPHRFVIDSLLLTEPLKSLWPQTGYVEFRDDGMEAHDLMWLGAHGPEYYNTIYVNDERDYSPKELRCMLIEQFGVIIGYLEAKLRSAR